MLTSFKAVYFSCFSGRKWVISFSQNYIHTSPKSWGRPTVFQVQSAKHTASMGSKREFPDLLELAHLGIRCMLSAESFCSLKSTCWSPNPQCDSIWRWGLWEVIRFGWGWVWRSHNGISALRPDLHALPTTWGHSGVHLCSSTKAHRCS